MRRLTTVHGKRDSNICETFHYMAQHLCKKFPTTYPLYPVVPLCPVIPQVLYNCVDRDITNASCASRKREKKSDVINSSRYQFRSRAYNTPRALFERFDGIFHKWNARGCFRSAYQRRAMKYTARTDKYFAVLTMSVLNRVGKRRRRVRLLRSLARCCC